jgi:K+-transporting ATPase ATPase B chain
MTFWVSLTLIFTVLCEAATEHLSREQTSSLKAARESLQARKVDESLLEQAGPQMPTTDCSGSGLKAGELVIVRAGEVIPADGEVVKGVAAVDESALTGESAPVIREPSEERSSVTAGTKVLSDWIIIRVKAIPGQSFLDRMIAMVEGSKRQKTPTEISVEVILTMLTILFLALSVAVACLSASWGKVKGVPSAFGPVETIGLFLCLAPTTIGALLPIVGISGMLRLIKANVIAKSGAAVEAAGNISVMMLDKTGTITMGDRQAREFYPAPGVPEKTLAEEAQLASLADTTPEGRSIVVLAKERFSIREQAYNPANMRFIGFSAQTRMSGVDLPERQLRKGAVSAIEQWLKNQRLPFPGEVRTQADRIAQVGGTPLVLADNRNGARGVIALRDVVKGGLRERFDKLRALKIETIMVTGDNALTAAAVAADAGVDRFIAEATPEKKLSMIRQLQAQGHTVAMSGDGTNDAPALAQADVALAMNSGTQPAKEAGNLIDLDSNPTKLIEVVHIGKQNLITIGALTTFSLSNDIAKFFTVLPAMTAALFPVLKPFDLIGFHSPTEAMRVALIFNAVVIPLLMPLALMGSPKPQRADGLLLKHTVIYGLGGAIFPLILMKLIAMIP